jgi:hypothetical protein
LPLFTIHVWKKRKSIRYGKHLQTKEQILQRINWEVVRIMLRGGYPRIKDNEEFCRTWGLPDIVLGPPVWLKII